MGVDVSKLKPTPGIVKNGRTNLTITFNGLVDDLSDNKVNLSFFVEPEQDLFIIDNSGERKKSVKWKESFKTVPASYSKQMILEVTGGTSAPASCSLRLEAIDSKGYRSSSNSFIIYTR